MVTGDSPVTLDSGGRRQCTVGERHRGRGRAGGCPRGRCAHQEHVELDGEGRGRAEATRWSSNGDGRRGEESGWCGRMAASRSDSLRGDGGGDGAELRAAPA